jgi:hypothetical protein
MIDKLIRHPDMLQTANKFQIIFLDHGTGESRLGTLSPLKVEFWADSILNEPFFLYFLVVLLFDIVCVDVGIRD